VTGAYSSDVNPTKQTGKLAMAPSRTQANVSEPGSRRSNDDLKWRALRTVLPVLRHPRLRSCDRQEAIVRDANLATDPAMVMAMVVNSEWRWRATAQFADPLLWGFWSSVLHQAMLFHKFHNPIISALQAKITPCPTSRLSILTKYQGTFPPGKYLQAGKGKGRS